MPDIEASFEKGHTSAAEIIVTCKRPNDRSGRIWAYVDTRRRDSGALCKGLEPQFFSPTTFGALASFNDQTLNDSDRCALAAIAWAWRWISRSVKLYDCTALLLVGDVELEVAAACVIVILVPSA